MIIRIEGNICECILFFGDDNLPLNFGHFSCLQVLVIEESTNRWVGQGVTKDRYLGLWLQGYYDGPSVKEKIFEYLFSPP